MIRTTAQLQHGFTLIEILIAVGIITLLTGAMIPGFSVYIANQNLKQAQEQVKNDIRTAQINALSGAGVGNATIIYWGIKFTNGNNYSEFFTSANTNCNTVTASSKSSQLPANVKYLGATKCLFISLDNGTLTSSVATNTCGGDTNTSDCLVLGNTGDTGANCVAVGVNSAGLVKTYGGITCP